MNLLAPKQKTVAPVVPKAPTGTDATRAGQDAVDAMLRRRGLKATQKTGTQGATLGSGQTAASLLLGG